MKKKNLKAGIATLAAAACALWASHLPMSGASTWRCGDTYTDQPCPDGKPLALDDARNAAQKRESDLTTREAQRAGDRLERERLRQEQAQARRQPTLIDSRPAMPKLKVAEGDNAKKKKKGKKEPEYFSAHDPVATAKKKAEKAGRRSSAGKS